MSNVNTEYINKILTENYSYGPSMKAVSKNIRDLISKNHSNLGNILSNFKKTDDEGYVFQSKLLNDVNIIVKSGLKYEDILHEYKIGKYVTNKLRYISPVFMYTYDMFSSDIRNITRTTDDSQYHLVLEYISGESVGDMIRKGELNTEIWFSLFCQLLISLEISQNNYMFCHYDLHPDNVLVRKNGKRYRIPIGTNCI